MGHFDVDKEEVVSRLSVLLCVGEHEAGGAKLGVRFDKRQPILGFNRNSIPLLVHRFDLLGVVLPDTPVVASFRVFGLWVAERRVFGDNKFVVLSGQQPVGEHDRSLALTDLRPPHVYDRASLAPNILNPDVEYLTVWANSLSRSYTEPPGGNSHVIVLIASGILGAFKRYGSSNVVFTHRQLYFELAFAFILHFSSCVSILHVSQRIQRFCEYNLTGFREDVHIEFGIVQVIAVEPFGISFDTSGYSARLFSVYAECKGRKRCLNFHLFTGYGLGE